MQEVVMLGLPQRLVGYYGRMRVVDRDGPLVHVVIETTNFDELCLAHHVIARWFQTDTSCRLPSASMLQRVQYRHDPVCVIPRCDEEPCSKLCGSDQWSSPFYWARHPEVPCVEDCDAIEFAACGQGEGRPVYIASDHDGEGHVLHLHEHRISRGSAFAARDYCIPRGMPAWRKRRRCFWFDEKRRKREGTIYHVQDHHYSVSED